MKNNDYGLKLYNLLFYFKELNEVFNRKKYSDSFGKFYDDNKPFFFELENEYNNFDEKDKVKFVCDVVNEFVNKVSIELDSLPRRKQNMKVLDYNLRIVTFLNPALLEFRSDVTTNIASEIVKIWNLKFKGGNISLTYFGDINNSFRKSIFDLFRKDN